MARLANLVRVLSSTTGTGTITLGSAVQGFLTPAQAGMTTGETYCYAIEGSYVAAGDEQVASAREVGTGVWTSASNTLTRSVLNSTNGNALLDLAGDQQVIITFISGTPLAVADGGTGQTTAAEAVGELIQALTADTTPDPANDGIAFYDASDDTGKKVTINDLITAAEAQIEAVIDTLSNLQLPLSQTVATATNDNASAGDIGEYTSSTVAPGAGSTFNTATPTDITSISLTAGDWEVEGWPGWYVSSGTPSPTRAWGWVSSTSATNPGGGTEGSSSLDVPFGAAGGANFATGSKRFSLSTTTTIYLSVQVNYTGGTGLLSWYGHIKARRVR